MQRLSATWTFLSRVLWKKGLKVAFPIFIKSYKLIGNSYKICLWVSSIVRLLNLVTDLGNQSLKKKLPSEKVGGGGGPTPCAVPAVLCELLLAKIIVSRRENKVYRSHSPLNWHLLWVVHFLWRLTVFVLSRSTQSFWQFINYYLLLLIYLSITE